MDDIRSDGRVLHFSPAMRIAEKAISVNASLPLLKTSSCLSRR
jgi:hypothetical protein